MSATPTLVTVFARLFESQFATLDGIAISCRAPDGIAYLDQDSALRCLLLGEQARRLIEPGASPVEALHLAFYTADPEAECVLSGWARHLQALLLEGHPLPAPTSMMRKRGVEDLAVHLVEPEALESTRLMDTVVAAHEAAARQGMRHHLLVTSRGLVVVAGAPPFEAMAHWHNVEFAARVACLAVEDQHAVGIPAEQTDA